MNRALMVAAVALPLFALVAHAEEAKAPKKAPPAAAATPAEPAKPAEAKPADAAAPAEAGKPCPCEKHLEMLKEMAAMHKAAAEDLKADAVAKAIKGGKDKKLVAAYDKKAKAEKKFHEAMYKALDAQIKDIEKMHKDKGPKLCEMMANAPDEAKAAMKERQKKMAEGMKAQAAKMAAMADAMLAE